MTEVVFLGAFLFLIGIFGIIINKASLIHMLMSIELMLLGCNLLLVTFSVSLDDIMGEVLALLVLGVAGAESAIGLAILVAYYRKKGTLTLVSSRSARSATRRPTFGRQGRWVRVLLPNEYSCSTVG